MLIDQKHANAASGRIAGNTRPGDAAANDGKIEISHGTSVAGGPLLRRPQASYQLGRYPETVRLLRQRIRRLFEVPR